jgi:energy-coupling factor transporter transmembrane protein EcfT
LAAGLIIALRAVVVIVALDGFSNAVDISEVAGLLERIGLPGLGLSMGVAVNLLPALHKSSQNVWRALQMRGGFRRQRWRALRLLLITVVASALRRAEEIALAAEARGFSPENSRPLPIKGGGWDKLVCCLFLVVWLLVVFAG